MNNNLDYKEIASMNPEEVMEKWYAKYGYSW